jgi:hypothetical protein
MQNLCSSLNALFRGTKVAKHPFKMMFGSVSEHFANIRYVKDAKLVFEPECTISGYQSCEASILVHWTQNDVWECSRAFASLGYVKDAKLVFEPNALFRGTKVMKYPF